ncbi:MAG: hypothetical protein ACYSWU_08235 [Planctomycetota bacterium]|jgi:hypothetical protein
MRRLCVLTASLLVAGLPKTCPAAEITYLERPHADGWSAEQVGCCAAQQRDPWGMCCAWNRCGRGCALGSRCWMGLCHGRRVAEAGHFNCGCRGSYKFPVPPQYTYHWPGLYAQQSMTEYTSPWRFPPLEPYRGQSVGRGSVARTLRRLPPPPELPAGLKSAVR